MPKLTQENAVEWTRAKTMEMAAFIEKEFGVEGLQDEMILRISMSARRTTSRGGIKAYKGKVRPWMSLGIRHYIQPLRNISGKLTFSEYKSIAANPVIGNIKDADAETNLAALIAHELAHVVDYFTMPKYRGNKLTGVFQKMNSELDMSAVWADGRHKTEGGHGARWQAIYALLRTKFVNNGVTDPKFAEPKKRKTAERKAAAKTEKVLRTEMVVKRGVQYRFYTYNGEYVARGNLTTNILGDRVYVIYAINKNGDQLSLGEHLITLSRGKLARAWIMENLL